MLMLALKRSRSLAPGQSFCETFVPEKNIGLLRKLSVVILILTTVGILFEGLGGCVTDYGGKPEGFACFFHQSSHMVLYLTFAAVAGILLLEASSYLPLDSGRAALSLTLVLNYVLWHEHSLMKVCPVG